MITTDIDPMFFSSGAECLNAFYDGKVDLAFMGSVPFIMGRSAGVPIRVLALSNRSRGGEAVVANSEHATGLGRHTQFTVGTVFGSTAHYLMKVYRQYAPPGMNLYTMFAPPELQLDAFRNGFLDGISVWEPYVSYAVERFDATVLFDDSHLSGGGLNLLVVREGFLSEFADAVQRLVDVLTKATTWIDSNKSEASTMLTEILSTPDMTSYDLACSCLDKFDWDFVAYRENLEGGGLHKELLDVSSFLTAEGIAAPLPLYPADVFADHEGVVRYRAAQHKPVLRLGYSSDLMCASFLVAGALNLWTENGFHIPRRNQLIAERIIHYDMRTQADLRQIFQNMREEDTKSEVLNLRRMLERCLKDLCERYDVTVPTKGGPPGLFKYLDSLSKADVVPPDVQSYSHLVRLFGNEAAHETVSHGPDLPILLEFTMRVFDWAYGDGSGQCPVCNVPINSSWRYCARCGFDLTNRHDD